jgi:hypothetical protein
MAGVAVCRVAAHFPMEIAAGDAEDEIRCGWGPLLGRSMLGDDSHPPELAE